MLAGSTLARGLLSARSSLEVGEGNSCVAHAGERRASTRLSGPRRLGQGVKMARELSCWRAAIGDKGVVTAYPGAA